MVPSPKKMRWGSSRVEFVRPVHWVVMIFGTEVIPASILGINSGDQSRGHRFQHNKPLIIGSAAEYESKLIDAKVVADYEKRKNIIRKLVSAEGEKLGARVVIEEDLLEEVTSLVEWPVALTGKFDEHFLSVPREALVSSLKSHQKCFYLLDKQGNLLPNFVTVSNIESLDPAQVIAGNERVIRPRLADARFFFDTDRKQSLASRQEQLKTIVFQQELGTVFEKSARVSALSGFIAGELSANQAWCERAALLSKCDLVTNMVGEFPELQGVMGRYYALADGEDAGVAAAVEEHYRPRFAGDTLPSNDIGIALALADKLETLAGMFGIGQLPTGDKDPFALRRHALGVLRILIEKKLGVKLGTLIAAAFDALSGSNAKPAHAELTEFIHERLRGYLRDLGYSTNEVEAVVSLKPEPVSAIPARLEAVRAFAALPEAESLAAANKRTRNILGKASFSQGTVDSGLFFEDAEKELYRALSELRGKVAFAASTNDYKTSLSLLATLRPQVDRFFTDVMVNAEDQKVRENRLRLLFELSALLNLVADISKLAA